LANSAELGMKIMQSEDTATLSFLDFISQKGVRTYEA